MALRNQKWIICGGLASGKSAVRRILESRQVRTIDADSLGHFVLEPDGPAFDAVAEQFPRTVVEGRIDRSLLAGVVFSDMAELENLESIAHPYIFGMIRSQVEDITGPVVVEMPILKSLGAEWRRMVIDGTDTIRVDRAVARGMSRADVLSRMALQPSRSEWLAAADLVIPNHGTQDQLEMAVLTVVDLLA